MRLDRAISESSIYTRSEIKRLLSQGAITVDGAVCHQGATVLPSGAMVRLHGVLLPIGTIHLMLNKPSGVLSATRDPKQKTVLDLVLPQWQRKDLFPAGRLDKDTEGFVLLTNDGDLAHRLLSPKKHVEKEYLTTVSGPLPEEAPALFAEGLTLPDGTRCKPATLTILEQSSTTTVCTIILTQGFYHQVKRMIEALGCTVTRLIRTRMGALPLDPTLSPGQCRPLTPTEVALLESNPAEMLHL